MKPEVKKLFVDALRSGKYRQCKGVLRKSPWVRGNGKREMLDAEFCASGVLCDLHSKMTGGRWIADTYLNHSDRPPKPVLEWCGHNFGITLIDNDGFPKTLERLNDNGKSFEELAAMIERQW